MNKDELELMRERYLKLVDIHGQLQAQNSLLEERILSIVETYSDEKKELEQSLYEVALTITITVKSIEAIAYLVEVSQAGIFTLSGFTEEEMGPMLGSFCPNILFPYAREAVSDLVAKGGFPQLLLAPVNFDAMYAQQLQHAQQQMPGSDAIN